MTVNLGKAIKEARFKRGMTQEDLAKMLCVSQSKLSRIEKNHCGNLNRLVVAAYPE